MFDIHIFTLYALNQTILKKLKEKGKSKGHSTERIQNAVLGKLVEEEYQQLSIRQAILPPTCALRSPSSS